MGWSQISSSGKHSGPCGALGSSLSFWDNGNGTETSQSHLQDSTTGLFEQKLWFLEFWRCLGPFGGIGEKKVCTEKRFSADAVLCGPGLGKTYRSELHSLQGWCGDRMWDRELWVQEDQWTQTILWSQRLVDMFKRQQWQFSEQHSTYILSSEHMDCSVLWINILK